MPAARTAAGSRVFDPGSIGRMQLIRAGLSIGFSVSELAEIIASGTAVAHPANGFES